MPQVLCKCGDPHRMIDIDTQPGNCIDGEWLCDECVAAESQCDRCHGTGESE